MQNNALEWCKHVTLVPRRESCVKKTRSTAEKLDRYIKINQIYVHNYRINGIYIRKLWDY